MTHYGKNIHLIESDINVLFEELLEMNPDQFEQWVVDLRKSVVDIKMFHPEEVKRIVISSISGTRCVHIQSTSLRSLMNCQM